MTTTIDIFDPRTYARGIPYDAFRRLRDDDPVSWHAEPAIDEWPAGPGFWAVTRYADVVHVSRTPKVFSAHRGATQIRDPEPDDLPFIQRMMLNVDPPDHVRLRRIVSRVFTPKRIERFADVVSRRAADLIDAVIERGRCDLTDVTDDFPLLNLADVIGVPESDRALLLHWTNRIIGYQDDEHADIQLGPDGRPVNPRSPAALRDMLDYAHQLAAYKRNHPADDIITTLVSARDQSDRLSDAEFEMFFFLLVVAGNDTLRTALPGGALALIEHPDERRRLLDDPSLLPTAVEEMLRWHPPVIAFRRTATCNVELSGRAIREGDKVVVYYCSANRDERQFPDPDRFDVARTPNHHVAFGDGPHVCLGAHFARLQLRLFFAEVLPRMPDLELAGPVDRLTSNFIAGIKHMPVRFTAGRHAGGPNSERG